MRVLRAATPTGGVLPARGEARAASYAPVPGVRGGARGKAFLAQKEAAAAPGTRQESPPARGAPGRGSQSHEPGAPQAADPLQEPKKRKRGTRFRPRPRNAKKQRQQQ
ncbi:hypothetical protein PR003_g33988 [Phytophthora rubi]|uniref:Uncharacterized protein n=1 Tax=Phytophthora rubi TaxID=129364 RepID=A0A6A4ANI8_9STRA|nr:hypothetical protein PR003_g33988 [Phytophthora rubi]